MAVINIECVNCGKSIEIEERFKKIICPFCGSNISVKDAINIMEENETLKREIDSKTTRDAKVKNAYESILNNDYEEAKMNLMRIAASNPNDGEVLAILLHIAILEFEDKDSEKLYKTSEESEPSFWSEVRELLKKYNNLLKVSGNTYLTEEDISILDKFTQSYKKMLYDNEICDKINHLINLYLNELEVPGLSGIKNKRRKKKGNEYLKDLIGVHLEKNYGVRRDMTIYYKHSVTGKHVYSKLTNFKNLDDMEEKLKNNLDDYKAYLDEVSSKGLL